MALPDSDPDGFRVRPAHASDLPWLAEFEVTIARASFGVEAVTDPAVHSRRVSAALGRPGELTLVAAESAGPTVGWAWLSRRTNAMTGAEYGNFRSLAVADHPQRTAIGERLLAAVLDHCRSNEISEVVGRVHATNLPMRTLYRAFGFEPVHLTVRRRLSWADPA
ncbi:GNAT family N-acetyltransferase [Natronosporangium hydrolyticum]|uniref:GNAT family N-acetyltransferase n=1 Tax=Natronosporangium hydrolyticum TaxID=2811111 RepID=A0A895YHV4_9ACTN|nr:GNAT family N-acetyltransferase [Natronosporangium hydrolyticum]QSB13730.1 GNAT family N-acetyltransferase [Natronosporangium hydrolyticum]